MLGPVLSKNQLPFVLAALAACNPPAQAPADAADVATTEASLDAADAMTAPDAADVLALDVMPEASRPPPTRDQILAATWRRLPNAPSINGKQDDVFFLDTQRGWSVNGLGQLWRTADGGDTWTRLINQPGTYFRAVTFLDENRGFLGNIGTGYYPGVTDDQPLYTTTNGGATIAPITDFGGDGPPTGICNLNRLDAQHIVATGRVGGPSYFAHSDDGGATWSSTDLSGQLAMLVDSHFFNPMEGFVTGASSTAANSRCRILHTVDGGATWQTAFTSLATGEMCWKLSFPSSRVGYAAVLTFGATPSSFLKTTDGGATWQELPFVTGSYAALGVGFLTEDIGWIGGEATGKPAYRTADGGLTWTADPSLGPYLNRFRFVGDRVGFAIGTTIYKLEIP